MLRASPAGSVRKASAEDAPRLADALARAFQDDPGWSHLLPDASDRTRRLRLFFETELRGIALAHGLVWTTEEVVGRGGVGAAGGLARSDHGDAARDAPDGQGVRQAPAAGAALEAANGGQASAQAHPTGISRSWAWPRSGRGRGSGRRSCSPALEALDAAGTPAYLESSTPRSRALYQRNGFEVTGEFNLPSAGPPLWQMWREPAG